MSGKLSMDQVLLKKLTDVLDVNLENELFGVKELAEAVGMSRAQLHRKLHAITGKSTSQFIREYRLEKAMLMLRDNVATASEIAYRVGFKSPTYFNTCFRNYYGYTPGEVKYRNSSKIEDNEEQQTIHPANYDQENSVTSSIEKISFRQRMLLFFSLGLLLIMAFSYYYFFRSNYNGITETKETIITNKSIAIIPFKNLSEKKENQYFVNGIMSSIQNHLTKIAGLKVISKKSMEKYANTAMAASEIADEVDVFYLLDGTVQKFGDSVRIITHLINAKEDQQLSSMVFDWEYKNIFSIQSTIAKQIADELNITLSPSEIEQIDKIPTDNLGAYNLFLQATFQRNRTTKDSYKNAIPLFEKAIALDSNFTEAYTELAEVWFEAGAFSGLIEQREAWTKAKTLSQKVLELDSMNIPIKDLLHIGYYFYDWNFELAEKYYQTRLNSTDLGRDLGMDVDYPIKTGRYSNALLAINNRIHNLPLTIWSYPPKAGTLFFLGKKEEAIDLLGTCDTLFTHNIYYLQESAKWYYYLEKYEKSKNQLKKYMSIFPDRPPIILWLNAVHQHMDGNEEGVITYLSELNKRYEDGASGSPAWFISLYYCAKEEYENAFTWLQKSYDKHEVEMTWLREEPLLILIRNDARYLELYKKVGFPTKPHGAN